MTQYRPDHRNVVVKMRAKQALPASRAPGALKLRVVHVLEGVENTQQRHRRDDRERGVGVLRRGVPRVDEDQAHHDQAGQQPRGQVGAEVEAAPHVGHVEGTHLVQAHRLILLADRQGQGEQAVLGARERIRGARAHDRHAHDDHGEARHEGGGRVPQVVAPQLAARLEGLLGGLDGPARVRGLGQGRGRGLLGGLRWRGSRRRCERRRACGRKRAGTDEREERHWFL